MFIDTHAHLFFDNFKEDLDEVIQRAFDSGVKYIIIPGTDLETSRQALAIAERYENIYCAVGVHPHDTKDWKDEWLDEIRELVKNKNVVAVGEIGLDYYYDFSPKDIQIDAFKKQLDLAVEENLPVIIHNREANEDTMNIIRSYKGTGLIGQFHCFAGSLEDARELVEMDHYISFPGNITFKKMDSLREIASRIDVENLLIETDCPFMTPVPHRGKRNEPSHVNLVAEKIAEIHNLKVEDVARTTTLNAFKLFGIGDKPELSFTYKIGNSLYINVTNRCNADCFFCDRKGAAMVKGYNLRMKKSEEPDTQTFIDEIGDPSQYDDVVFCGYGEPTIRWQVVKDIAKYVKDNGGKTRLNTDGHGNFINKRDITKELDGLVDVVSISLNSVDPNQYAEIMRVKPEMHAEMIDFAKKAKEYSKVVMTIVGLNEVDTEIAKKFVTDEIGVNFRLREYF